MLPVLVLVLDLFIIPKCHCNTGTVRFKKMSGGSRTFYLEPQSSIDSHTKIKFILKNLKNIVVSSTLIKVYR